MNGEQRAGYALLRRELRARRGLLARIGLWSVIEALPSLLSGLVISAALNSFLGTQVLRGLALLSILPVTAVVAMLAGQRLFPLAAAVVEPVRDAFVTAVVEGAVLSAIAATQPSDTAGVSRLTQQVQSVRNILFGLLRSVRQIVFTFVAALVGLAILAPAAALVAGALLTVALVGFALLLPGLVARHRAVLLAEEDVARRAGVALRGVRDAIACAAEERAVAEVGEAVDTQAASARALARASMPRGLLVFVGGQLPLLVLLAGAPWLLRHRYLTLGELAGTVTYLTTSLEPALRSIVGVVSSWGLDLVVNLGRLGEQFAPPQPAEPDRVPAGAGTDLAVRDLTFSYGPHAAPVVRGLNFTVAAGSHLALVGPSGIGKSTLAGLLAGLLRPQHGAVLIGGLEVTRIAPAELRQLLALIPQEAYIFAGTLRENLCYLAPHADDDELLRAATAVGLTGVLDRLGGFDAAIQPGGDGLSVGEKQLVALTRVYLSPARIVILDEATANLDPVAEARAEAAFAARPGALIVIAHRISSARRAARILLLDGDTVQLGTDAELLARAPLYADLVGCWEVPDSGTATRSPEPARGQCLPVGTG